LRSRTIKEKKAFNAIVT